MCESLIVTYAWKDEDGKPKHKTLVTVTLAEFDVFFLRLMSSVSNFSYL